MTAQLFRLACERKTVDQSRPFAQLKAFSLINDRARVADKDPARSQRIRERLPGTSGP